MYNALLIGVPKWHFLCNMEPATYTKNDALARPMELFVMWTFHIHVQF